MSLPNPQDPNSPLYDFIDTQPLDQYPTNPDLSPSHFTTRQLTPENITNTWPIVVTITSHGLINGQALRCTKLISIPFALATGMEQLNNQLVYVNECTANTFILTDINAVPIDGRNFTAYISGGQFTMVSTTNSALVVNPSEFPPPGQPPWPPV